MVVYGAVKWGFGLRSGKVINEYLETVDTASSTFDEALERHRDFYVHEPVTFYFAFDEDVLDAGESGKIDAFLEYLDRNPTVRMSIEGFADMKGGASARNLDLSLRRAEAVRSALVAKGVDPGRIDDIVIGHGASVSATVDAGTGDQGGDVFVGANQEREANRWANRRVVLTFEQTASTGVGAAGP
jgi:outer membrane protein OmpA-like peptidoglycan-associated protein